MTGPFSETDNCVGTPIKGDTCGVLIRFAPDQIGPVTGALAIDANVAGGRIVISLAGIGSPTGVVTASPGSLDFGTVAIGVVID